MKNVAVTAGFICAEPRKACSARHGRGERRPEGVHRALLRQALRWPLEPVKETLLYLVHETHVWTEITTLLIPGENDFDEELER